MVFIIIKTRIIYLIHLHQRLMCLYPRRLGCYLNNNSPQGPLGQTALDVNHHYIRKGFEKMTYRYMIACRRSHDWIERMTLLFKEGRLTLFEYKVIHKGVHLLFLYSVVLYWRIWCPWIRYSNVNCIIFLIMVGECVLQLYQKNWDSLFSD